MPADDLRAQLRAALTAAMKARDTDAVTALRTTLGAIANAEAVDRAERSTTPVDGPIAGAATGLGATEVARRQLTDEDVAAIVLAQATEREDAAAGYERAARHDHAERLRAEAAVLRRALTGPPQRS
jgi:uncharacterized protein